MSGFLPRSTRTIGARYLGRTNRLPSSAAGRQMSSQPAHPVTAAGIFKRVLGGSFLREKVKRTVDELSKKPYEARTPSERKFLDEYHKRSQLKPTKSENLKKVIRGAYEVTEEQGFKKGRFETGTTTEKVVHLEKSIDRENAPPPPPKIDQTPTVLAAIRTNAHERFSAHAGYSRQSSLPATQEPQPLPFSSASGWTKSSGKSAGSPGGGVQSEHRRSTMAALVYGIKTETSAVEKENEGSPKIVVRESSIPSAKTPALGQKLTFTGGSRLGAPRDETVLPFSATPAVSGTGHDSLPLSPPEPPPPPAPSESSGGSSGTNVGEGLPI